MNEQKMIACARRMKQLIAQKQQHMKNLTKDLSGRTKEQQTKTFEIYKPKSQQLSIQGWREMELMVEALEEVKLIVVPSKAVY